jgi:hypothetical protein
VEHVALLGWHENGVVSQVDRVRGVELSGRITNDVLAVAFNNQFLDGAGVEADVLDEDHGMVGGNGPFKALQYREFMAFGVDFDDLGGLKPSLNTRSSPFRHETLQGFPDRWVLSGSSVPIVV